MLRGHAERRRERLVLGLSEEGANVVVEGSDGRAIGESEKNGDKVGHGSAVDEHVPDGVVKVEGIKDDESNAERVGESTDEAPLENGPRTNLQRRAGHNHAGPSHEQVESIGNDRGDHMNGDEHLGDDSNERTDPFNRQNEPSQTILSSSLHHDHRHDRSVGSGNYNIDHAMVELLHSRFPYRSINTERVVEGRN